MERSEFFIVSTPTRPKCLKYWFRGKKSERTVHRYLRFPEPTMEGYPGQKRFSSSLDHIHTVRQP